MSNALRSRGFETDSDHEGRSHAHKRCPKCDEPIDGIEAVGPGEHRFASCGHAASSRFLESHLDGSIRLAELTQ
ncbi:MAG: hypothetical protein ABEI76_01065 [Halobacteriales archaeon]